MRERFSDQEFNEAQTAVIDWADQVCRDYMAQGYTISIRQLYYQGVSANRFPNTEAEYKKLVKLITDARTAGLIDWDAIVDRGRFMVKGRTWDKPADSLRAAADAFQIDRWEDQPIHLICMVEKQALEGIMIPVCSKWQVPFYANKGYSSASTMYEAGKRLQSKRVDGKKIVVIYSGDMDPSGLDMGEDVSRRLRMFSTGPVEVRRIALNMKQIAQYNPPENPAKMSDSRAKAYVAQYGNSSWELDALRPDVLADLVDRNIQAVLDHSRWDRACEREEHARAKMLDMIESFGKPTDLD